MAQPRRDDGSRDGKKSIDAHFERKLAELVQYGHTVATKEEVGKKNYFPA